MSPWSQYSQTATCVLSYKHLCFQTIDRGSRGIATVVNAMVFNIIPTIFELSLVTGILAYTCGPQFSVVALGAVGSYAIFTLSVTQWRTK